MLIGLATRSLLPPTEVDDLPLHAALARRGVSCEHPVWDDPAVDWVRYDAVLIRTTWDYQNKLPQFLAWVERVAAVTRLFNPAPILVWNTHKHYLRELAALGVPLAETVWLARGSTIDLASLMAQYSFSRGFLKPCVGSTARETLPFSNNPAGLALAQAHVDRLLPQEDLMLQPFLESVTTRGEWSAIFIDGALTHCVRKIPVPGDYRVQDDFGASDEPYAPSERECRLAEQVMAIAARPLGLASRSEGLPLLYARADFLWDNLGESVLTELELVEPSLFFRHGARAAELLADALIRRTAGA